IADDKGALPKRQEHSDARHQELTNSSSLRISASLAHEAIRMRVFRPLIVYSRKFLGSILFFRKNRKRQQSPLDLKIRKNLD
ncbi:hypothetical protein, partial [Enterococcus faecium]